MEKNTSTCTYAIVLFNLCCFSYYWCM